jgi:hypothetical protein
MTLKNFTLFHSLLMSRVKRFSMIVTLTVIMLTMMARSVFARELITENYRITITHNCSTGYVYCDNVSYEGISKTGDTIRLTGTTWHTWYVDPQTGARTPSRFLGYFFRNGEYSYRIDNIPGKLTVYQGETVILEEEGTWLNPG